MLGNVSRRAHTKPVVHNKRSLFAHVFFMKRLRGSGDDKYKKAAAVWRARYFELQSLTNRASYCSDPSCGFVILQTLVTADLFFGCEMCPIQDEYCDDHCRALTDTGTILCNAHMDIIRRLRMRQMVTFMLCTKHTIPIDILKHIHSFLRVETVKVAHDFQLYGPAAAHIRRYYRFDDVAKHEQLVVKDDVIFYNH